MKAWAAQKQTGFTIVEIIVVVVIIAVLAAITTVSFRGVQQRSRDATRTRDITQVQKALEKYRYDNGSYPLLGGTDDGTTAYPLSSLSTALVPKYIDAIPTAPSGSPAGTDYQYIRGTAASASYGIRMYYESKTDCHRGVNNNAVTIWWSPLVACPSS